MSDNILIIGREIAKALTPAEESIDVSMLEQMRLMTSIIEGGLKVRGSGRLTHKAIMCGVRALDALGTARTETLDAHAALAEVRDSFGLDPRATGCTPYSTVEPQKMPASGHLRVAA